MLPSHSYHFLRPWETYMAANDFQLWEFEGDLVNIGYRPAYFTRTQWPSVAYLGQKRNVELTAFDEQRPVFPACRRKVPQPRHDSETLEVFVSNIMLYLPYIANWVIQIDTGNPNDTVRVRSSELYHVGIRNDWSARSIPGSEADLVYAALVHKLDQLIWTLILGYPFEVNMALFEKTAGLWNIFLFTSVRFQAGHIHANQRGVRTSDPLIGFAQTSMMG